MSKFILHSSTLERMLLGSDVTFSIFTTEGNTKRIHDIPSIHVIQRAQFEALLMYHFIYVNPHDKNEKILRYSLWKYTSHLKVQELNLSKRVSQSDRDANQKIIDQLKTEIQNNPRFQLLSPKQQKRILKQGEEKLFKGWSDIMKETGFTDAHMLSSDLYHLLSSHAHSFGLSAMDVKVSNYGYHQFNVQVGLTCSYSKIQIAVMIMSLVRRYQTVEIQFNGLPQSVQDIVRIYHTIATANMSS